jgi:hypothetical protein
MLRKSVVMLMTALVAACLAGTAAADVVCADSSYCEVNFNLTFSGAYQNGQNYNVVTVSPTGAGQTFADPTSTGAGGPVAIDIRVYVRNCQGDPLEGIQASEVVLHNSALCICPGGNGADAATDANGCTTFSGSLAAGGCAATLDVYADGIFICTIPVGVNSADAGFATPCTTDAGDIGVLAAQLGSSTTNPAPPPSNAPYTICQDFTENGATDAGEVAFLAANLGALCQ